jgi:imidazolonepropionase
MTALRIINLSEVATPLGSTPRRGGEQGGVERLTGVEVLCSEGEILQVGPSDEVERRAARLDGVETLDAAGGTLIPGFVDPHTHLPWAGTREEEFVRRLAGADYTEIAAAGGGILSTVRSTREAPLDALVALVL